MSSQAHVTVSIQLFVQLTCATKKMNVEVLAHAIWIFRPFWSDLSVQLMVVVQLLVMGDSHL